MRIHRLAIVIIGSFLLNGQETFAQSGFPLISLKAGMIRNLQAPFYRDLPQYSFYPEIQITGQIARSSALAMTANGCLYWGYWDDGVDKASSACVDCHTYTFSSHIVGARMALLLERFPIVPLSFALGLSRHFIQAEFVGGYDLTGQPGQDFERRATTIESIAYTNLELGKGIGVIVEFQRFWPVGNNYQFDRSAFKLGLAFSL